MSRAELVSAQVAAALGGLRFNFAAEADLQRGISERLVAAGLNVTAEVDLGDVGRIDFMVGDVGIEVKVDGSLSALTRQLHRYAQSDRVAALVVVTSLRRLCRLPAELNGKAIDVIHVGAGL